MKKHTFIYLLAALLFVSCYGIEKPNKPDNLISEDKMVEVLVELSIMSSAKGINKRELENRGIVPDTFIYRKHKIDSIQFANSNNYYAYDIEKYSDIYARVKDSLEKLRTAFKKEDSISKAKKQKRLLKEDKPKNLKKTNTIDTSQIKKNRLQKKKK
ncbi:DUF4296 domain-containing protein [Olleya sp. R77988]|uniref:DUF4296 domain-containing protein n=1 Tax=Olleya sp. R77988 TaxID=3093875 RepID=UPI0037C9A548